MDERYRNSIQDERDYRYYRRRRVIPRKRRADSRTTRGIGDGRRRRVSGLTREDWSPVGSGQVDSSFQVGDETDATPPGLQRFQCASAPNVVAI
jgi:hypothetical protein